jgi:energy-coupling factor transport system permease protein
LAFLQHITLGRYVALDSPIHRLDPRTKLIASLTLMIVALSARSFVPLLTFTVFQLVAIALTRLSYRLVLGNLKPFIGYSPLPSACTPC